MKTHSEQLREADGRARDLLAVYQPTEALEIATNRLNSAVTPDGVRHATLTLMMVRARVLPC